MMRAALAIGGGVVVGIVLCYGGYRLYKYYLEKNKSGNRDPFAEKLKERNEQKKRFDELINNQSYVELLTGKELSTWFKENRNTVPENAKMVIITPTPENLKGLGYYVENDLDKDSNIIQVFYNEVSGEVYKIRLVNYTNIESNLQAQLIEQDGMIIVTE